MENFGVFLIFLNYFRGAVKSSVFDIPSARRTVFMIGSMRQSIKPVEITDMDTDNTKYGKAKFTSPLAHKEPFGTDV